MIPGTMLAINDNAGKAIMAYVLRRLGASVGSNLHCAHDVELSGPLDLLCIEDDVTIQTGAYVRMSRWVGSELHVGPVHLGSSCKIGMRAAVANHVTVGRATWITPFTPILGDVGSQEMWEGAPARFGGRCTELKRTAGCWAASFFVAPPPRRGLYPSRGLGAALLMYRVQKTNLIQRLWTWTIVGQYLRALAGARFTRLGASECDLMLNLVPELANADARVSSPMQAFDWNAVSFGNDCMIDGVLQYHTFENMTLKVKRTEIRDGSTVSFGATVMGGAGIEPDTTLLPLSLVLKEMHLPTDTYWGSPAEPVANREDRSTRTRVSDD